MNPKTFKSLIRYYLSCIDAEEATSLQLRKNQENKSYIFLDQNDSLFSEDKAHIEFDVLDNNQKKFIEQRSPDQKTLIDLQYGFPVFCNDKDMLSPLFYIECETTLSNSTLRLLPQIKKFSINRTYFINHYEPEEVQKICEELEGEFGSFQARMKAVGKYIPSLLKKDSNKWIFKPILFRSNNGGINKNIRYDLTQLLEDRNIKKIKNTALHYLLENSQGNNKKTSSLPQVLEIGMLNDQQESAVVNGLAEPLSIVTGPPGTGKTQVVTALLASTVYNNQTVLFSSNNNMPVDGVYERLGQYTGDIGNWLIRFGNKNKIKECFENITALLERINHLDLSDISINDEFNKLHELDEEINQVRTSLKLAQNIQQEISRYHQKEKTIVQELPQRWVKQFSETDPVVFDTLKLRRIVNYTRAGFLLWMRYFLFGVGRLINTHNRLLTDLFDKEKNLIKYENMLLLDEDWESAIVNARETAKHLSLHQGWAICVQKRKRLEAELIEHATTSDLYNLKEKKSKVSATIFEKNWLVDIKHHIADVIQQFKKYYKDIENYSAGRHKRLTQSLDMLKRFFPIWITTNQSLGASIPPKDALFDLVVIDEAGQCDIPSLISLLYRAKRAVIIGDPHQFRHITSIKDYMEHNIAQKLEIEDIVNDWSFKYRSAFDRSASSAGSSLLLKQHYRCHPDIIEFSNVRFYEGRLVKQIPISKFEKKLPIKECGLIWHNVSGEIGKTKKSAWNPAEVKKATEIFSRWDREGLFLDMSLTYGVVTPFKKQAEEMRKAFSKCSWYGSVKERFTIGTAHSFQGSECDVLIYSPVITTDMKEYLVIWAAEQKELINVAVTRAKSLLYIVGDLSACKETKPDTEIYQLAHYAENIRKNQKHPLNKAEKAMASILEELGISYSSQHEFGQYCLDFLINTLSGERYNIEIDGDIHLTPEAIKHDERRDKYVEGKGLKTLRFAARDVISNSDLIKQRLLRI